MEKIQRDTTKDLFRETLKRVMENGQYDKAAAIVDYFLPNEHENNVREDIELSNYMFDFKATAQFGGSEGIYIDCYLVGEYTEDKRTRYNSETGQIEPETRRHIGTFKTLKDDLESMKIMGELCGALTFYAHEYVNKHLDRYTPAREIEAARQAAVRRDEVRKARVAQAIEVGRDTYTAPDEDAPVSVFLTKDAANAGEISSGAWLKLPAAAKALHDTLVSIGAQDGVFSIAAAQSIDGFADALLPATSCLDEMNMLAAYLKGMDVWDREKLTAILHHERIGIRSVSGLINIMEPENFKGVETLRVYSYDMLAAHRETIDRKKIPLGMEYEDYGRYCEKEENGAFTEYGYVYPRSAVKNLYTGVVPQEYRITQAAADLPKQAREPKDAKPSILSALHDAKKQAAAQIPNIAPKKNEPAL